MNPEETAKGPFSFSEDSYRDRRCYYSDGYLLESEENRRTIKDCGCRFDRDNHEENCGLYKAYIYDNINRMYIGIGGPKFIIVRAIDNLNRTFETIEKRNKSKIRCAMILSAVITLIVSQLIVPAIMKSL